MGTFSSIKKITLAFTGASGLPYGIRLLECLMKNGFRVSLICSQAAYIVAKEEMHLTWPRQPAALKRWFLDYLNFSAIEYAPLLQVFGNQDWRAPIASGSNVDDAMVICPCTMGTVAAIATGVSDSLIERAADVILKERRSLILVPRETPFSTLHLENMLKLSRMGAVILPPAPGFYHHPANISDLIDFIVARILDQLHTPNALMIRWSESLSVTSEDTFDES